MGLLLETTPPTTVFKTMAFTNVYRIIQKTILNTIDSIHFAIRILRSKTGFMDSSAGKSDCGIRGLNGFTPLAAI